MEIYTIYDHPADQPDCFVVRRWFTGPGEPRAGQAALAETLEAARALVPFGLINIGRDDQDHPAVLESWI